MSDERVIGPGFSQDTNDAEAPTERDPACRDDAHRLAPGVALSVLWWVDDVGDER